MENALEMKELDLTWMHVSRLLSELPSANSRVNQTMARRRRRMKTEERERKKKQLSRERRCNEGQQ